jgi:hypothetical protein
LLDAEISVQRAGSIDSLAPASSPFGLRQCRSAPAGFIPATASTSRAVLLDNEVSFNVPLRLIRRSREPHFRSRLFEPRPRFAA